MGSLFSYYDSFLVYFPRCLPAGTRGEMLDVMYIVLLHYPSEGFYIVVTGILTMLVLAKVFLRLSRINYKRIEVLYTP